MLNPLPRIIKYTPPSIKSLELITAGQEEFGLGREARGPNFIITVKSSASRLLVLMLR